MAEGQVGPCEKGNELRGVKVEHLSTRELSVAHSIQAEHGAVEARPVCRDASLLPLNDDFVGRVVRSDDSEIHLSLGRRGL
jgi:hypothetical protein